MSQAMLDGVSSHTALGRRVRRDWDKAVVPLVFALMIVTFAALDRNYLSATNIINVLNQVSILAVVTVGASIVIFTGGFDLSAGAIVALSGVVGALVMEETGSLAEAVAAGIGAGLVVGIVNGLFVGYLGVSPLIVTLGALNICRGLALIRSGGSPIDSLPPS
jgi:ribose transport system permease protein